MEVDKDVTASNTVNRDMPSSSTCGAAPTATSSRKKLRLGTRGRWSPQPPQTRWRSSTQEKIYRRRLLEALQSTATTRSTTPGGASSPRPFSSMAVKEAADSALALTARGRSRWSRSILNRRWRMGKLLLKAGGKVRGRERCNKAARCLAAAGARKQRETAAAAGMMKGKKVRERLRELSRLIPGCSKASTPRLLEEAADYMAALELQVKAMRALADALSSATVSPPPVAAAAASPGSPPC